ncbi:ciliogenesis-associated TTC17-interacting protein isoform X3 [Rhinoderma darwinii]|uniref:ciliogenesis-associated TTC17-interacting protein isoform X3 n=1 Tax=Rhinoderma darwinii TaxID=43563 RepID=UPI003F665D01
MLDYFIIVSNKMASGGVTKVEISEPPEQLSASAEALEFMSSVGLEELRLCLFSESLESISESGAEVGSFTVNVQSTYYEAVGRSDEKCFLVDVSSRSAVDDVPCGSSINAYISLQLETLEQNHHEFVKLKGHSLDKKTHMRRRDDQMVISRVITEGQRDLGSRPQLIGKDTAEVYGIERAIHSDDVPITWQCYFLPDGHLTSRVQVGSPVTMRIAQMPILSEPEEEDPKPVFEKKPLNWEEDAQLYSEFLERKEELMSGHETYLRRHPEMKALVGDFLQFLLLRKPDDIVTFAAEFFGPFSSARERSETFRSSTISSPFRNGSK